MLRDVFYYNTKPNVHPREQFAENLADARSKATTRDFWIINEFCDYRNFDWDFDFEFLPDEDVWAEDHNNVWPSQHQKDSGTWLCPKEHTDIIIYRNDVDPVIRKNQKNNNWVELDLINHNKFDFSWHPDPTDPPYIYKWPSKFFPAEFKHVLEYRVPGATQEKYMNTIAELVPEYDRWVEHQEVDKSRFDMSWRPNPLDPPFIYVWGNKYIEGILKPTLEYHAPGATDKKYMPEHVSVLPEWDNWVEVQSVDKNKFDFSWRPDPREPAFIYVFGNEQHDGTIMPTVEYHCPDATEVKYVDDIKAKLAPKKELFEHLEDSYGIDYSWRPDPTSPPYIYAWGNQWNTPEDKVSIQFVVSGASEYKYMDERAIRRPCLDNWNVPDDVDITGFDFSWEPNPAAPPYIYEFATQWQKTGGPQYIVPGAIEKQYIDFQKARKLSSTDNWSVPDNIDSTGFDFSWHPDDTSPPYTYVFATQWAFSGGPLYTVEGATELKYVDDQVAIATADMTNWVYDSTEIDIETFDFSWHPYVEDQPYIYEFGTQWQKTGGPKYITPGADSSSPTKYVDTRIIKSNRLPNSTSNNWKIINDYKIKDFDFSWHPDNTDEPYIYVFGNNLYSAEECATVEYHVLGATERKYVVDIVATLDVNTNWEIPLHIDTAGFDFSWIPNPNDPLYIYEFGTQHQKTGGPRYIVEEATEVKYLNFQTTIALPNKDNWKIPSNVDIAGFDFSWHPDNTDPGYIYQFGTQWALSGGPAYTVPGATEIKYMDEQTAVALPNKDNWVYDASLIHIDSFDFSWHPYIEDQPYIYEFGTQWQKTGGPKYIMPGADSSSPIKYIDTRILKSTRLANKQNNCWKTKHAVKNFDWSWHPDDTDEPYIYVFGNNLYPAEECATVEYRMPNATQTKYISDIIATLDVDMTNWVITQPINEETFDFKWIPNPKDPPYVYRWGNKYISNKYKATVEYIVPGATDIKYMTDDIEVMPEMDRWEIPKNIDTTEFDFTWRPDPLEPNLIWEFGTQHQKTGGPRYIVEGATEVKYVDYQKVTILPVNTDWFIPDHVDVTGFDFSWHPDATDPPYIYQFGTQWALSGGPRYEVLGATEIKYMDNLVAKALPDRTNWEYDETVIDIETFDFSWHPYIEDQPYVYQFGTQWQKTGGPKYITPGADLNSPVKYIDTRIIKANRLANAENTCWVRNYPIKDFDWSWHPDETEEPYIYVFGNNQYLAEECATIEYIIPGATTVKYIPNIIATLDVSMDKWDIPKNVDATDFDFSWIPNPNEPAYIYEFGTQWQKTGGPKYVMPGAWRGTKYVDVQTAKILPNTDNWVIPNYVDTVGFDFSWHPDETEPAYIYQFGTQWALSGGPRYVVEGATEIKYMDEQTANALPDKTNWVYDETVIDVDNFDFSWHPYVEDQPYVYQFGTQWQKTGGPKYITPGSDLDSPVKYIDTRIIKARRLEDAENTCWVRNYPIKNFDYSWHPDETEDPYTYVFGNNQFLAEECATIEYRIPGATTIKYIPDIIARLDVNMDKWVIPDDVDATNFDFSWIPNPSEPAYIYEFGTQWQKTGGPKYVMPGAWRGTKYVDVQTAKRTSDSEHWTIPDYIDKPSFDFSWHPDATEEPYIYVFATQWAFSGGPVYTVPGATEIKYVDEQTAKALPNRTNWEFDETLFDVNEFDFSWHPYVEDQPYIYQFGTQWWETGGPRYVTPGTDSSSPIKYIDTRIIKSMTLPRLDNWEIPEGVDVRRFDFSWIPHPKDPPYIYQFGTKVDNNEGPRYINSNTSVEIVYLSWVEKPEDTSEDNSKVSEVIINQYYINTTLEDLVNEHPNEIFWAMQKNINYDNFDFDWRPGLVEVAWELNYVHVFGSPDSELTQTYFVSAKHFSDGNTDLKFVEELSLTDENLVELFIKPDMFFVDRGNSESLARFEALKAKYGTRIQKTRYLNSWVDTINRCANRATSSLIWVLNSELDYNDFNFDYYPNPWQMKMVQVFGTQWSHWGTTFMVNRETFAEDTKYINIIEHLSNLNFVKDIRATATKCVHDIVIIDHGNKELADVSSLLQIKASGKTVTTVSYQESYLKTFKDIIARQQAKKEHYIWVCSSVCDYSNFDFSYVCDPFSRDNLHVFPSGKQKFGDTFFIDVNNAREVIGELEQLENFTKVNYNAAIKAARLPEPIIITNDDTHTNAASKITDFPYVTLITSDNSDIGKADIEPMNLWSLETKNIYVTSTGATRIVVPKEIKDHVTKELYEYPYIKRAPKLALSNPLDIVFLSNGETGAEENYEHLLNITKNLPNRVVRVNGVNGRAAAYHAAAEASETPWMFTVFAKLKVSPKFDFNWQPDRMQVPKHYIFHAKNPVNGLAYGHQAMIAYNKKLTLANDGKGLDFTLDDEHEVVPLISGVAQYNTDEFSTWRTAFREVIKLRADDSEVSKERLDRWLNKADGDFAQYSIKGALDADEYYDEVDGDFDALKLSYEWIWLKEKFDQI